MEKLMKILEEILGNQEACTCDDFMDAGLLDSMDVMDLVEQLEEEYDIEISGCDILPENFKNVAAIKELLLKYVGDLA